MPRRITAGAVHMVTRRCTRREFLLRPDGTTNGIFGYCLADAARRTGVQIISWCAMSNHYHAVIYDPQGRSPAFIEHFHKMVARSLNARWGRRENFWSTEETCLTLLATDEDVLDAVVYTLTNPVTAGLVERASDWPGSSSWQLMGAGPVRMMRPEDYFSPRGVMPESVELCVVAPPTASFGTEAEWIARVKSRVEAVEEEARVKRAGEPVLDVAGVLGQAHTSSPTTPAERSKLRPTLACKDRTTRIAKLEELQSFRFKYRSARIAFAKGDRSVVFPEGTYRLRLVMGVCCPDIEAAA
jgi:putative transposase